MTTAPDDLADISPEDIEAALEKRTLLESWSKLLDSIDEVRTQHLGPQEASRILKNWPPLKTQELDKYLTKYYDYMTAMREILRIEIEGDPSALENISDDAVDNKGHYLNLLLQWQLQLDRWGEEWLCTAKDAHISLAALAETQNFFFGSTGILQHLDSIQFEFTEEDQNMLADILIESKEA